MRSFGDDYLNVREPSVGSPLLGGYRVLAAGDLDFDGSVGFVDLGILLSVWGPCPPRCRGDLDFDGSVGCDDLGILLNNWG